MVVKINELKVNGELINKKDIPNFLNNYFADIAESTCDFMKIQHPMLKANPDIKFDFEPPDLDALMYIIRDIDADMSSCVQGLNMKMCERLISMIPEQFVLLFANSMFLAIFTFDWAVLTVTLLPKSGDKINPGN